MAEKLYRVHLEKPFYEGLVNYMTSGTVVALLVEGKNAVEAMRKIMGPTDPREAPPGTIRGDFRGEEVVGADGIIRNIVHGSDSPESAQDEIAIFFS